MKVVDAVTAEDAVEAGETVRFIVVPSSRVVIRVIEDLGLSSLGLLERCSSSGMVLCIKEGVMQRTN